MAYAGVEESAEAEVVSANRDLFRSGDVGDMDTRDGSVARRCGETLSRPWPPAACCAAPWVSDSRNF